MPASWPRTGRHTRRTSLALLQALVLVGSAAEVVVAGDSSSDPVAPTRITSAPAIDGRLDEPEWQHALTVDDFFQRVPSEGAPASERTVISIMYTETALYVGVRALDSQATKMAATVQRRDNFEIVQNEQFAIAIDSYNDARNGFWFSTNPLGARVDAQFFDEGQIWTVDWDGVWDCESRIDEQGWTSELRIPFSTLRFAPGPQTVMGINLFRRIIRTNEQLFSPLIPLLYPSGTPAVSQARKFVFRDISAGRNLKIRPYVLGGSDRSLDADRLRTRPRRDVGVDLEYGVTPSLTAQLTVNTDFALTEVDDRQINLTRFSLFFPEKRQFFLQNAGLFSFGIPREMEMFFSRRIGLGTGAGSRTVEIPITAGGKLTGRLGRTEVGVLDVRTDRTPDHAPENFFVGRAKYGLGSRSYLGLMVTHRTTEGRFANAAAGADASVFVTRNVGVSGFLATTTSRDATDGTARGAWNLSVFRRGERASFQAGVTDIGDGFRPGMGFLRRPGTRTWTGDLGLPRYVETATVRRVIPAYRVEYVQDRHRRLESWLHEVTGTVDFQSNDIVEFSAGRAFDVVPVPFAIFDAVTVQPGAYEVSFARTGVRTKPGRKIAGSATTEAAGLYGGRRLTSTLQLQWKIDRRFTTSTRYETARVTLPVAAFRTHIAQVRMDYARDTRFTLSALAQYDNSSKDLGLNLRMNYLHREGTELSIVYTEVASREAGSPYQSWLFGSASDRSLVVKFAYLFDL